MQAYPEISDYGLIGNSRSAALVSKCGSIDWCCLPEFHSPALFSAILDQKKGGKFVISPAGAFSSKQNYISQTNVLETVFYTASGTVRLTDCFVAMQEEDKKAQLFPDHEILRVVDAISGSVEMKVEYCPTLFYGKKKPKLRNFKKLGIHLYYKENIFVWQGTLPEMAVDSNNETVKAAFSINEGEQVIFSLSSSAQQPAIIPEIQTTAQHRLQQTIAYWQDWAARCKYKGIFKDHVLRSALALKLLSHAPSGAIIAAATTSLPEDVGGNKNWDYRYCWLRDASFTVRALIKLGYHLEVHAYMNWIIHATRLTQPKLQVMYNVFGIAKLKEKEANWLEGYKDSKPVRLGNAAYKQYQLDVYGEVLDAIYYYSQIIEDFDRATKKFAMDLGKTICKKWTDKDDGIWEKREEPAHYTHSKVMCWVGLDRLIKLCKKYGWQDAPLEEYERTQKAIAAAIEEKGFNKNKNAYVEKFGGTEPDLALLTLSLVGYCRSDSDKMQSTVSFITRHLFRNGFIYRYLGSLTEEGREGAFIIGNFWLIENYVKTGKLEEAIELFKTTVSTVPAQGLLSEEIAPDKKEWLGNTPQAFSHIGLINAALSIQEHLSKEKQA